MTPLASTDTFTLLIVDDTPGNLSMAVDFLEECGYRVSVAQDGEEGLARAALVQPDLILLDVMMPDIDGFEVCRRLKAQPATADIPVIFMTALADTQHKVAGFQAGGVDYTTKPLQIDEVAARVATHLKINTLQRRLAAQNAELALHRDQLEHLVAERTAELIAANEALSLRTHALNQVGEAAYLIDENARFLYVNDESCRALGYAREELLGMTVMDIGIGWTTELWTQTWAHLRSVGMLNLEATHRRKDGSVFPVDIHASYFEYGGRSYDLALVRDITERKRAERELILLKLALDHSFDATYLIDTDLRFRFVNEAALRTLGYSREELQSMTLLDIDPHVTREVVHGLMQQTAASVRFPGTVESQHRRKDGSIFPIEVGATTFSHEGETLFLTVVRDITERKAVERKLQDSEQKFRSLAENSPDNIARYDRQHRMLYINPHLEATIQWTAAELLGRTPSEIHRPTYITAYESCIASVLATGNETELEITLPDIGYGVRYHQVRFVAERDDAGEIVGVLAIGRDVSSLIKAEQQLKESRDLLRRLAEHSEHVREEERKHIAREIHDELGQMLTAQRLDMATLKFQFGDSDPALAERCQRLMNITDQTIQVVRSIAAALRPAALDMGILPALEWLAVEFSKRTGIPCQIQIGANDIAPDEEQAVGIFRIVQESLTNVARHAEAHQVAIVLDADADAYRLSIRDDGKGFEPATPSIHSFGLVGIRERALMLGGTANIKSTAGRGTTIDIHIPRQCAEGAQA